MKIVIVPAERYNIREVSQIHYDSFKDYFMHSFGLDFLNIYYKNYLSKPENVLLVAKNENTVIGFVAGTLKSDLLYQSLFNSHFFSLVLLAIKRFITSRKFRGQIIKKGHFITKAFKTKIVAIKDKKNRNDIRSTMSEKCSSLLSIAVRKDYRGKGVSTQLIKEFERKIQDMGSFSCALSVKAENLRAIGFYKKMDWQIVYKDEDSIYFKKIFTT